MAKQMKSGRKVLWIGGAVAAVAIAGLWSVTRIRFDPPVVQKIKPENARFRSDANCPEVGDEAITRVIKPIRQEFGVPAIAAAIVSSDGIQSAGAVGVRKRETDIPVELRDAWHLGSAGKAMTSTLVARLVEQGTVNWETPLVEIFPEMEPTMHREFRAVTLLHLLSHRAGIPSGNIRGYAGEDVRALREKAARTELAKAPTHSPGEHFAYSNMGYIIAAAVAERLTGKSWESLTQEEIFGPLKMDGAGFGGTGTRGIIDQPWPHTEDGEPTDYNGPAMDNLPVLGPAGRVHSTLESWSLFVRDQLRGARGEVAHLKPESYRRMHTAPFGGDYGLAWRILEIESSGEKILTHIGDNEMNHAKVWLAPARNIAILVCINQSGSRSAEASQAVVQALLERYLPEGR